jgi:hypothetical protein
MCRGKTDSVFPEEVGFLSDKTPETGAMIRDAIKLTLLR